MFKASWHTCSYLSRKRENEIYVRSTVNDSSVRLASIQLSQNNTDFTGMQRVLVYEIHIHFGFSSSLFEFSFSLFSLGYMLSFLTVPIHRIFSNFFCIKMTWLSNLSSKLITLFLSLAHKTVVRFVFWCMRWIMQHCHPIVGDRLWAVDHVDLLFEWFLCIKIQEWVGSITLPNFLFLSQLPKCSHKEWRNKIFRINKVVLWHFGFLFTCNISDE